MAGVLYPVLPLPHCTTVLVYVSQPLLYRLDLVARLENKPTMLRCKVCLHKEHIKRISWLGLYIETISNVAEPYLMGPTPFQATCSQSFKYTLSSMIANSRIFGWLFIMNSTSVSMQTNDLWGNLQQVCWTRCSYNISMEDCLNSGWISLNKKLTSIY